MAESKSMPEEHQDTLQNVLTEDELLKLTGLKKSQLADSRTRKRLPFLYLERDVVTWLKSLRVVINSGE